MYTSLQRERERVSKEDERSGEESKMKTGALQLAQGGMMFEADDKYACLSLQSVTDGMTYATSGVNVSRPTEKRKKKQKRGWQVTPDPRKLKAELLRGGSNTFCPPRDNRVGDLWARAVTNPVSPATVERGPFRNNVTLWNDALWHKKTGTRRKKGQRIYSEVMLCARRWQGHSRFVLKEGKNWSLGRSCEEQKKWGEFSIML